MPQSVLEAYGIKHVKGLILHGPPGTGKTLIARQLAKFLNAKEPKIVNGPELFDKFVGDIFPEGYSGFFECVDPTKGTVIGWSEKILLEPQCWR